MSGSIRKLQGGRMMNSSKVLGRKALFVAISVVALGAGNAALAGTAGDNLAVSATVIDNCTISTSAIAFGNYDPIVGNATANLDGTGSVTVTCTLDDVVQITLGQGANADAGSTAAAPLRQMSDGASDFLSYSLFSDASRSVVWGDDATVDQEATGTGAADAHTVYGRVSSGQNKPAGSYTDTVAATVTF
jgi:spore coat protein U-like protein